MRVLYIYRHPDMGFSIGRVFRPIEECMRRYAEVDTVYLPIPNYSLKGIRENVKTARNAVTAHQYDVVHITGTEHYLIPFLRGQRIVVTVHDLGFWVNQPKTIKNILKYLLWIKSLNKAWRVTFISEKTRQECTRYVKFAAGQTRVVPNPVGVEFQYTPKDLNLDSPKILHLGTKPNKNLNNTILALKGISCHLRIIGDITDAQRLMMSIYGVEYSNASNLTDDEIRQEYVDCDIVSFPSFYEGFGMPIIEGQATGRPVLTSDLAPMNLIAGDAAVLVNPADVDSLRAGYETLMRGADNYVERGLNNVQRFRLDKIVQQYLSVYKETEQ